MWCVCCCPPAHRQLEGQHHHQQRNNRAAYLARLHNQTCPYSMEASQQARSRSRQHDSAGKVGTSAGRHRQDAHTLRVPPVFLMICMLSRWLLPFSLSTASTASLAKCSLSCVRIFELQHREVYGSMQHEGTAACAMCTTSTQPCKDGYCASSTIRQSGKAAGD